MMWVRLENFQTFGIDLLLLRYLQSLAILLNLIAFTGFKTLLFKTWTNNLILK